MEFDDIKKAWKNSFQKEEFLDKKEIDARLNIKSKSNTALNKVKRSYKFEIYGSVLLTVFVIYWLFTNISSHNKYMIILLAFLFFGLLIAFAVYNYLKVKNTEISTDQIKPALKQTISDIERYVNFSRSNFTKFVLFPFTVLFGMFLGITISADNESVMDMIKLLENSAIIKMIIIFVVASLAMIPLSLYLNKKMYKQHLDELKNCLKEFEQIEEDHYKNGDH